MNSIHPCYENLGVNLKWLLFKHVIKIITRMNGMHLIPPSFTEIIFHQYIVHFTNQ